MAVSVKDFTLDKVYTKLIEDTGVASFTKVKLGDTTAGFRGGVAEVIEVGGKAFEVGARTVIGQEEIKDPKTGDTTIYVSLKPVDWMMDLGSGITTTVTDYITPSTTTLNTFKKMGKGFDDYIKSSATMQFFGMKSSDVICATFCVVVSFLSCSERKNLYDFVREAQKRALAAERAVGAVRDSIVTASVAIESVNSVFGVASGLIKGASTTGGGNAPFNISSVIGAVSQVQKIGESLKRAFEVMQKGKLFVPIIQYRNLWAITNNVLYALQNMAVQAADEMLNKIVQPIEEEIRRMQPSNCLNNLGARFFNKIIGTVRALKRWILIQIAQLFTGYAQYNKLMDLFNVNCTTMLELSQFLEALKLFSARFGDLAIACGLEPCSEEDSKPAFNYGRKATEMPTYTQVRPIEYLPTKPVNNIDEIANSLKDVLKNDIEEAYVTPESITTVYTAFKNAPKKILDMLPGISLGEGYEIYTSSEGTVKVVHKAKRFCGE